MTQSPWRGCWREGSAEEYVLRKNTTAATTTEISGYRKAEFKSFRKGEDCHDMVVIVQVVTLGCGFAEEYLYLCKQPGKVDRFGFIVVASRLQALLPVLDHRAHSSCDDWDGASLRQRFELAGCLPAVQHGQTHIHQD